MSCTEMHSTYAERWLQTNLRVWTKISVNLNQQIGSIMPIKMKLY